MSEAPIRRYLSEGDAPVRMAQEAQTWNS
jgi:hypothetical protein